MACPALQYYLINGMIFEKVTLQLLSETFLILRRNERDMIQMYIHFHVKYTLFLSDFKETPIFSTNFRKILQHQIL